MTSAAIAIARRSRHRKDPMPAHRLNIVAVLFAAGLLACAPAHAGDSHVSASVNNLQFHLLDLDLTDNITPSITFTSTQSEGSFSFDSGTHGGSDAFTGYGTVGGAYADGSASAASSATGLQAQAHASATRSGLIAKASVSQELHFTLSPSTRLTISAQGDTWLDEESNGRPSAYAHLSGLLDVNAPGSTGRQEFSAHLHTVADAPGPRSGLMEGMFSTGALSGTGILTATANVSYYRDAASLASPVPEPATYGMLAAGLLVLGGAARGKASRGARRA